MTDYIAWIAQQDTPIIKIVVADSGFGLTNSLRARFREHTRLASPKVHLNPSAESRACIHFSFDASGTRHQPGLRRGVGLTRVKGYTQTYRGSIMVRAANAAAGFECRDGRVNEIAELQLPYSPGTSIEAFFGFTLTTRKAQERVGLPPAGRAHIFSFTCTPTELGPLTLARIRVSLDANTSRAAIVLLYCHDWHRERLRSLAENVETLSRDLMAGAAVILHLEGASPADCDTTFQALDELRDIKLQATDDTDSLAWAPPVLVLDSTGQARWVGASKSLRQIMGRLLAGEQLSPIDLASCGLSKRDYDYLASQRDWIEMGDSGKVRLCIALEHVDARISDDLVDILTRRLPANYRRPPFL